MICVVWDGMLLICFFLDIVLNFNPDGFYSTPIFEWMNQEKDNKPKYTYTEFGRLEIKNNDKDDDNDESNM